MEEIETLSFCFAFNHFLGKLVVFLTNNCRVEYRHPAFVETKLVEIAEELPVGIFALEVLRRLDFHGIAFVSILHAQVETSGAERHLTVDASLPVGDALKKRHASRGSRTHDRAVKSRALYRLS